MTNISLPVDEYLKQIGELTMRLRHAKLTIDALQNENAALRQAPGAVAGAGDGKGAGEDGEGSVGQG